jgi:hypothetical protein
MKLTKIKNFWSYVSILIIVLSSLLIFHFSKIKYEEEYKETYIVLVRYNCDVETKNFQSHFFNYCDYSFNQLRNPIKGYFDKIIGEDYFFQKFFRYDKHETSLFVKVKMQRKFNATDEKNLRLYIKKLNDVILSAYVKIKITEINQEFLKRLFDLNSIKIYERWERYISSNEDKRRFKDKIINLINMSINNHQYRISLLEEATKNSEIELIISQEKDVQIIKNKFYRLTYINVFLVSLIFAIFVNVLIALAFELKNNFKKRIDS